MTSVFATAPQEEKSYLGLTRPISEKGPSDLEIESSEKLTQLLASLDLIESHEDSQKREQVLGTLNLICQDWARSITLRMGHSEQMAAETKVKICTFGSYRLGVHVAGADIDTLCIGPRHISKDLFFEDFVQVLQADPRVTNLSPVPEAYVPVIKFEFEGIDIDLVYACLRLDTISPSLDVFDNALLRNLDPKTARALNGVRVTDMILSLVPHIANFRSALRAIKYWAKQRGIYSNVFGFCGGVSWAMLLARVCQLYPNAASATLLQKFYHFYTIWKWPTPVMLNEIVTDRSLGFPVWSATTSPRDMFPVITPCYPAMNSTYNVFPATLRIMQKEFERAQNLCRKMGVRRFEAEDFAMLFKPTDLFLQHKNFVRVMVSSADEDDFQNWIGLIQSKMRSLISRIDYPPNVLAFPFPNYFPDQDLGEGVFGASFYVGLDFGETVMAGERPKVDLSHATRDFLNSVRAEKQAVEGRDVKCVHIRAYDLPEHVFFDERRPRRKKKRKQQVESAVGGGSATSAAAESKRASSESLGEVNDCESHQQQEVVDSLATDRAAEESPSSTPCST